MLYAKIEEPNAVSVTLHLSIKPRVLVASPPPDPTFLVISNVELDQPPPNQHCIIRPAHLASPRPNPTWRVAIGTSHPETLLVRSLLIQLGRYRLRSQSLQVERGEAEPTWRARTNTPAAPWGTIAYACVSFIGPRPWTTSPSCAKKVILCGLPSKFCG